MSPFASRAGIKLAHALTAFGIDPTGLVAADLGSAAGGFVDCLLASGASRVYAVETGRGVLDWRLRCDPRVRVMEGVNALHVSLPEPVDLITVDVGWTRQGLVLPVALRLTAPGGRVVSLLKPHYEAGRHERVRGTVKPDLVESVKARVIADLAAAGIVVERVEESPLLGGKGRNREFFLLVYATPQRIGSPIDLGQPIDSWPS